MAGRDGEDRHRGEGGLRCRRRHSDSDRSSKRCRGREKGRKRERWRDVAEE